MTNYNKHFFPSLLVGALYFTVKCGDKDCFFSFLKCSDMFYVCAHKNEDQNIHAETRYSAPYGAIGALIVPIRGLTLL